MIEVLQPGLFTTIQDLGRPGYSHVGVSIAGAADSLSMRVANRLVGNPEGFAVLECALQGGTFRFLQDSYISVCGAPFDCNIPMWSAVSVPAGGLVKIGGCAAGARCYVAVRGGLAREPILGSVSTHILSGFGKILRVGDRVGVGSDANLNPVADHRADTFGFQKRLRVTPGPDVDLFSAVAMFQFLGRNWAISDQSNRQGVRTTGVPLDVRDLGARPSEGVALGAIQVPPGGEPIILFVDSQTTGGYPVIANVISADLPSVGQLRPRDIVSFAAVSLEEARILFFAQEEWIRNAGR